MYSVCSMVASRFRRAAGEVNSAHRVSSRQWLQNCLLLSCYLLKLYTAKPDVCDLLSAHQQVQILYLNCSLSNHFHMYFGILDSSLLTWLDNFPILSSVKMLFKWHWYVYVKLTVCIDYIYSCEIRIVQAHRQDFKKRVLL